MAPDMATWRKIGLIAGGGALPVRLAAGCRAQGLDLHVIRLAGVSDESLSSYPSDECAVGEAGKIIRTLKSHKCDAVVFAGIVRRPNFSALKVDWRGAALMPRVLAAAAKGDASILDVLVETVEAEGMRVIAVEDVLKNLAALQGVIAGPAPSEKQLADIQKAAAIVSALGAFDVGQGAVVAHGLVLAIEAAEGTDAMLSRCAALPNELSKGGVLVKRPKPDQELRVDLPTVGPETVRRAAAAGLAGIAMEAGGALVVDRDEMVGLAEEAGLFIYGFSADEVCAI